MAGVLLGTIQFVDREVPDTVKFGRKQMIAIHKLMGGNRVIDTIGPDFPPISWSGLFLGSHASPRARSVEALAESGAEVNLYFGTFAYNVVVSEFEAVYKHEWEVRYRITCEVVSEIPSLTGPVIDTVISSDFGIIEGIASASPAIPATPGSVTIPASFVTALNNAQTTISTIVGSGQLADLSLAQLQPAILAVQNALTIFQAGSGKPKGISLDAISGASTRDGINSFITEVQAAAAESDLQTALAYLGRIVGNLTSAGG